MHSIGVCYHRMIQQRVRRGGARPGAASGPTRSPHLPRSYIQCIIKYSIIVYNIVIVCKYMSIV